MLVTGEDGTGKETIVYFLYMHSSLQNHPLISINCSLLNDKSWAFLLEHHNSPLADQDSTLYFSSIDVPRSGSGSCWRYCWRWTYAAGTG